MLQFVTVNLLIDTCTWLKLDKLEEESLFKLDKLYSNFAIFITHDAERELKYYNCKSYNKSRTTILPIHDNTIYQKAIELEYDEADASILSQGDKNGEMTIVSEDRMLLLFARMYGFSSVQLIDLFKILTEMNLLKNNELYRINKELRRLKNITKTRFNEIKKWLRL